MRFLIAVFAVACGSLSAHANETFRIVANSLNVRTGPWGAVIGQMHQGQVYVELDVAGEWTRTWFDDREGWVYNAYTEYATRIAHRVTAEWLNVRTGPGTGYAVAGQAPGGSWWAVTGSSGAWRRICWAGAEYWVHGNFLTTEDGPTVPPDPGSGTPPSPFIITSFPFVQENDTSTAPTSSITRYSAAPSTTEGGPELYYRVPVAAGGVLKVEVAEENGVDVDIHVLTDLAMDGGTAVHTVARANRRLVLSGLTAGDYWIVIDSYSNGGVTYAGAFRVAVELDRRDTWQVNAVAPGITWRKKIFSSYGGGVQTVNVLEARLDQTDVKPHWTGGGFKPSIAAHARGATAAVNGGFFSSGYSSIGLVKVDGVLRSTNHIDDLPRRAFGVTTGGAGLFADVAPWSDWPAAHQAIGGHPNLVRNGAVHVDPWDESSFNTSRHPRTALGMTLDQRVLLVTVDGRTSAGAGLTLTSLANLMIDLGARDAINLDGGGSTCMWIRNMSINGIVNHPSDNGAADHAGERTVANAVFVHRRP